MPPGFNNLKKAKSENETDKLQGLMEWGGDGLIGLPRLGLGSKKKSIAKMFQARQMNRKLMKAMKTFTLEYLFIVFGPFRCSVKLLLRKIL
ncbi:pumilio homolog 2-like [Lycium ferocissimum]|uniref:pumilio homolog 2-like n=1 Tax=Lycium ferocissimum TaxID=112874 RepID=UPI0028151830|nr:pumilio homolog 2-like [Lycium ferocissimum]